MSNPYTPPATDATVSTSVKTYSPGQVAWATFLGSPIAGCVLLAINYRRFGKPDAATAALALGAVGTALLLVVAFTLPEDFPGSLLTGAYTLVMYQCAKSLQRGDHYRCLMNGGTKASSWAATGIGLLSSVCLIIAIFGVLLVAPEAWFSEDF